ncbi:chordin-like isoform X2 [Dreissena polymorpha]|nr:chordin-like isoform X2 [Dreissena polymorpha]
MKTSRRTCALMLFIAFVSLTARNARASRGVKAAGPDILKADTYGRTQKNTIPGCWLGDQFYLVGDVWSPIIEPRGKVPCVKCQCAQVVKQGFVTLEGRVVCRNIESYCPPTACREPYRPTGACCRKCHTQGTTFSVIPEIAARSDPNIYANSNNDDNGNIGDLLPIDQGRQTDTFASDTALTALLVGRGFQRRGRRPVQTNAVAMVHILDMALSSLRFSLRFSRLKDPMLLKITNINGDILIQQRLPKQSTRNGVIYGAINNITLETTRRISEHSTFAIITTSNYKRGELFGILRQNKFSNIATFEALLGPESNRGSGGLVTMFYDSQSNVASFSIKLEGMPADKSLPSAYIVTFEKSAEILYQHILRFSKERKQMIGQLAISRTMSKQIARGKMKVRVTARDGHSIIGHLKPRLNRDGYLSVFKIGGFSGHVLLNLVEDGSIEYKIVFDGTITKDVTVDLQRLLGTKGQWEHFITMTTRSAIHQSSLKSESGTYRRVRARDMVAILTNAIRLDVTFGEDRDFFYFTQFPQAADNAFEGSYHVLRPADQRCSGEIRMFSNIRPDCTVSFFLDISAPSFETGEKLTMSFETQTVRTQHLNKPWGIIGDLAADLYSELNGGKLVASVNISNDPCDTFSGMIQTPNRCWSTADNPFYATDSGKPQTGPNHGSSAPFRCYYGGQFYEHAQSWVPDEGKACVTCMCIRGDVRCDDVMCPATPCKYPVQRPGECCLVCEEDNETEYRHTGSCYYEGDKRWHPVGIFWHPYVPPFGYSKCAICSCMEGTLEVNCTRLPCPALSCDLEKRYRINRDDCCQVCPDDAGILENTISIESKSQKTKDCMFGTKKYQHAEKWHPLLHPFGEMSCYICSCKSGKSKCRKKSCPILECKDQYTPTDACCPICKDKRQSGA